jgi:predicted glycosyltransferase
MTQPRLQIVCYVAGLTGLGHYTRMATIAAELATRHDVIVLNGGRGAPDVVPFTRVDLPALPVVHGRVQVPGPDHACWPDRAGVIARTVQATPPDVLLVEHYPFSKWELGPEIELLLTAARAADPATMLLASVRDIVGRTRREQIDELAYSDEVLARMESFDGLLVHGDPALVPLAASFPATDRLPVPVHHTGYVVDPRARAGMGGEPDGGVLVAAGGGAEQSGFLAAARAAAAELGPDSVPSTVFRGPFADDGDGSAVAADGSRGAYLDAMRNSAAAVTRAGYNTTVELWAAGVPTVLVPDRRMSDQVRRAEAFASRGAGIVVDEAELPTLAGQLRDRLADSVAHRGVIDTGGARRTREIVEEWAARRTSGDAGR